MTTTPHLALELDGIAREAEQRLAEARATLGRDDLRFGEHRIVWERAEALAAVSDAADAITTLVSLDPTGMATFVEAARSTLSRRLAEAGR